MSKFYNSLQVFFRSYVFFIPAVRVSQNKVNKSDKLYYFTRWWLITISSLRFVYLVRRTWDKGWERWVPPPSFPFKWSYTCYSNFYSRKFVFHFRAISAWYNDRSWFHSLCKRVMEQDWSWNRPALDYLELYHAARKWKTRWTIEEGSNVRANLPQTQRNVQV